jgi:Fe-S-cluster containining protein
MVKKKALPALNGLSIESITISQDGELKVIFDLPVEQTTHAYQRELQGVRSIDVYEAPELQDLCRDLFRKVRKIVLEPDPERVRINCDTCKSSDCCRKYNVLVTDEDIDRLAAALAMPRATFRRKYLNEAVDWCADYRYQLACDDDDEGDEKCVFLKESQNGQMRCSVYAHRPQICRDFDMRTCNDFVPIDEVEAL